VRANVERLLNFIIMYQEKEVNYNGRIYTVTSEGRIFRTGGKPKERHELKGGKETTGYLSTRIGGKAMRIHVLVATTFLIRPEGKMHVNHKNGIKHDNTLENLEWCTHRQNIDHAVINHLTSLNRGSKNGMAKITEEIVMNIKKEYKPHVFGRKAICEKYGITLACLKDIIRGRSWNHVKLTE